MGVSVYNNQARGNWRAQVKHKGITKTKSFKLKSEALKWGYSYLADLQRGDASGFRDVMTVSEILDHYIDHKAPELKGDGPRQKRYIVNALKQEPFSNLNIADLKPHMIVRYRDDLLYKRELAKSTVRHRLTTLSTAINII
ncbi:hypothetical protein FE236_13480 [Mariprofundus erugo]|uniref:hypothetical protein n=1 Tax=Mariprofundus erugo TaxID=2528639 RepID=UPI0010FD0A07|nr:hypothetical protein [Mariprofundus erugo]TLS72754.1 hypothetical protein FE236_13480 [Mariprofundus erugo]